MTRDLKKGRSRLPPFAYLAKDGRGLTMGQRRMMANLEAKPEYFPRGRCGRITLRSLVARGLVGLKGSKPVTDKNRDKLLADFAALYDQEHSERRRRIRIVTPLDTLRVSL